jgi:hypothetical protein
MVKALRYKLKGRDFETCCGERVLLIYITPPAALDLGVYSGYKRSKYIFPGNIEAAGA